jgi:hypothetical protein
MQRDTLDLPVPADAARVFFGLRAAALTPSQGDDDAAKAKKREDFFRELGNTFMPGTPLMQAPLGLSAYLPAVIDPPEGSGLPDEVAIIVYASRAIYDSFRNTSLSRRMYTRSHAAVFDMGRAAAVFPNPVAAPATGTFEGQEAHFAYMSDSATDWQSGYAKVLFIVPAAGTEGFAQDMLARVAAAKGSAADEGIDQIVIGVTDSFAALWVHSASPLAAPAEELDLLPANAELMRNLDAQPSMVVGDTEQGEAITGPCAFTFRFSRHLQFFEEPGS